MSYTFWAFEPDLTKVGSVALSSAVLSGRTVRVFQDAFGRLAIVHSDDASEPQNDYHLIAVITPTGTGAAA